MGYRSDVKLALSKKDYLDVRNEYEERLVKEECNDDIFDYTDKIEYRNNSNIIIFSWDYMKWDEYTDESVELLMNLLREAKYTYHFIRVGEGWDSEPDIEDLKFLKDINGIDVINSIGWEVKIYESEDK